MGARSVAAVISTSLLVGATSACTPNKSAPVGRPSSATISAGASNQPRATPTVPGFSPAQAVSSLASTPPTAADPSAVAYVRYLNPRYRFGVDVPATFVAGVPPDNGDGQMFTSLDRRASLAAWGEHNVFGDIPVDVETRLVSDLQQMSGAVTYKSIVGSVVVVSGTYPDHDGTTVLYARTVVDSDDEYTLWWTYPVADKGLYDPQVEHTANSFRTRLPGNYPL